MVERGKGVFSFSRPSLSLSLSSISPFCTAVQQTSLPAPPLLSSLHSSKPQSGEEEGGERESTAVAG